MKRIIHYVEKPVDYCLSTLSFFVLVIATTLLLWQLYGKIRSYINNPVQVSTEYQYPNTVAFPGIILCNTKPLQISKVGPTKMMSIINYYNFKDNATLPKYLNDVDEAKLINMTEFYLNNSQQKDDFILGCTWPDGSACSPEQNVEAVITDYGVCYRFILDQLPNISYSGSTSGLMVMLNIATYENIKGHETTVGAKLALYSPGTTPLVTQIGFDSPPGFQTSVGMKLQKTKRLPKADKGNCDPSASLHLYKKYTYAACRMQKKFMQILDICKCKPYNTPDEKNILQNITLCNGDQQLGCVIDQTSVPIKMDSDSCLESCSSTDYSMMLSYSQISVERVESVLSKEQKDNMTAGYLAAVGTRSTYEAETKLGFDKMVGNLLTMYQVLTTDGLEPDPQSFQELKTRLATNLPCYSPEFSWKQNSKVTVADLFASRQPTILRNSLSSAQQLVQSLDSTFNYTFLLFPSLDRYQTARDTWSKSNDDLAANPALQNDSTFMTQYKSHQQQVTQLLSEIQGNMNGYNTQYQSIVFNLDSISTNVSSFAQQDFLLSNASTYVVTVQNSVNVSKNCLIPISLDIQNALTMVGNVTFDIPALKSLLSASEQKTFSCTPKMQTVANVVNNYYNNYSSILSAYQLLLINLDTYKTDQYQFYSKLLSEQVVTFQDTDYYDIQRFCVNYLNGGSDRATLSDVLVSDYKEYWLVLQNHFTRFRTQLLNSRITIDNFVQRMDSLKNATDPKLLLLATKDFFGASNATDITYQCNIQAKTSLLNWQSMLQNHSNLWRQAFDSLISDCTAYRASFTIDEKFYSANIVTFNIYFQDLAVVSIQQFLTYSEVGMISDVAGTIGIILGFVGTTGLTLCITVKSMAKKVKEQVKKRLKPKNKDGTPHPDTPEHKETVMVVVEEIVEHDDQHSVIRVEEMMDVDHRMETPDMHDKSGIHDEQNVDPEIQARLKRLKQKSILPKLE